MKAISVKYLPAGAMSPARYKAFDTDRNSILVSENDPLMHNLPPGAFSSARHRVAAEALCRKMKWDHTGEARLIGGSTRDGYVFVFANSED